MSVGYSSTPLVKKLGIREGMTMAVLDPPENYWDLLEGLPEDLTIADPEAAGLDFLHVFAGEKAGLEARLRELQGRIAQNGMIWVSWPKQVSGVETDLTGDIVRQAGLSAGLVDVKVCAVDEIWSGLKFMIPRARRR